MNFFRDGIFTLKDLNKNTFMKEKFKEIKAQEDFKIFNNNKIKFIRVDTIINEYKSTKYKKNCNNYTYKEDKLERKRPFCELENKFLSGVNDCSNERCSN